MNTYDDSLLAVRFAALAPEPLPGDWADVVGRIDTGLKGRRAIALSDAPRRRRRRLLVVLVVLALVVVLSASALAVRSFFVDKGFIGIPPTGATASAPMHGELVLFAFGIARGTRTRTYVYADGRLIWQREHPRRADLRASANRESTGFLEQRLTRHGVNLLRTAVLSTGLLGRGLDLSFGEEPCFNTIGARSGDRLVRVIWHGSQCLGSPGVPTAGIRAATRKQARSLRALVERLAYPRSGLPPSAWSDRRIRAYVPAKFEVSYGPWPRNVTYSAVLEQLPAPVGEVLRTKQERRVLGLVGSPAKLVPAYDYRFTVSTEEARSLRATLVKAGLEVDSRVDEVVLAYRVGVRHPSAGPISIGFDPILPHGEPAGAGG